MDLLQQGKPFQRRSPML